MYEIRKNVKTSDFSKETRNFLSKIGFVEEENLSEFFKIFLEKNDLDLNGTYLDYPYGYTEF